MSDHKNCATYERAMSLYAAGESALAIDELQELLDANGDDGRLWEVMGNLAFANDDFALAQSSLERASVLVPLSAAGQLVLAKCYDRSGHRAAAGAIYRHVATLKRLAVELLEPLASGLGRSGEVELALAICRRAAEAMPENPDPLVGMVHYMRRLRRPVEQILPVLRRAHDLDPSNCEYRISLAWMLHEVGRSEDGAELLAPVPCERYTCIRCLTLMQQIFERVGDAANAAVCRLRLAGLTGDCAKRREGWNEQQ
jgi:tetratricopeptide (TPR) repeat protein